MATKIKTGISASFVTNPTETSLATSANITTVVTQQPQNIGNIDNKGSHIITTDQSSHRSMWVFMITAYHFCLILNKLQFS